MAILIGTILLFSAVVIANIIHLIYPKLPLSIMQIISGVLLTSIPVAQTNFTMHPELFMMVVIAPLLFNDGSNQSFRRLTRNYRSIFSISVTLALVTVLFAGEILHGFMPDLFPLSLAFLMAAIITPTDAVAVKSLTVNMEIPENVNDALEYESLFNDASGIVLLDLSLTAYMSGTFSIGHGLWFFAYVFFGGIIFGAIMGNLVIILRQRLMRKYVDIGSIVIPINVMTPVVVYWLAEELGFSGILAVVSAGIVHSILYDRLRLTSTKVQMATTTIWKIISDALNGIVFVLLGVMLPHVLQRTATRSLLYLFGIGLLLYIIMTFLRFVWTRMQFVNIQSKRENLNRDSFLMAVGGVHGTITLALAFSLPVTVNNQPFELRNTMILIASFVIIISMTVGAIIYPIVLPPKSQDYTEEEFRDALNKAVHYAINKLHEDDSNPHERSMVADQLGSQAEQFHTFDKEKFEELVNKTRQIELSTLDQLTEDEVISEQQAQYYCDLIAHSVFRKSRHGFFHSWVIIWHRIKWRHARKRRIRQQATRGPLDSHDVHMQMVKSARKQMDMVQNAIYKNVDEYLREISSADNVNEISLVKRIYLNKRHMFGRKQQINDDIATSLFIQAFQVEHSYVQEQLAAGKLSQGLANALNEQISTDELVYAQSLE
ncbi:MAG: sodium:proton antiporter [Limosilactobacillus sp.]|uniref:cation:proton antiporter n=1 Tax=Limosilactobacillus sp. TaxID=2773925 RepID=UPI00270AE275|nr:sodium:proton antiporter [Limosilactobacillus sp.]